MDKNLYLFRMQIYRVFTLDIHKTAYFFHMNATIVDKEENGDWILRDHLNTSVSTLYMA